MRKNKVNVTAKPESKWMRVSRHFRQLTDTPSYMENVENWELEELHNFLRDNDPSGHCLDFIEAIFKTPADRGNMERVVQTEMVNRGMLEAPPKYRIIVKGDDPKPPLSDCTDFEIRLRDRKEIFEELVRRFDPTDDDLETFKIGLDHNDISIWNWTLVKKGLKFPHDFNTELFISELFKIADSLDSAIRDFFLDSFVSIFKTVNNEGEFTVLKKETIKLIKERRIKSEQIEQGDMKKNNATTAQQVLMMHYIFEYCQVKNIDQTHKANFIEFFTGKNEKNIYDAVRSPLATKKGDFRKRDLQAIRPYFENIGLFEIVKMINNELNKPET
jgi:hypothetical protein